MEAPEKSTELEVKYQKLATEYSKVRSQATVLKKALLEEQTRSVELKEMMKEQEQKIRKHTHEMESLTFRNEQLAKRISVLQQELQNNSHGKKSKARSAEISAPTSLSVLDEELHKKILENAQLVSTMADRDLEISYDREKIQLLESKVLQLQNQLTENEARYKEELGKLSKRNNMVEATPQKNGMVENKKEIGDEGSKCSNHCVHKEEAERWKSQCEMLRSKPESNEELNRYYELQIMRMFENEEAARSEAGSLWAENEALYSRLEQSLLDKNRLEASLEKYTEELQLTTKSYKTQLDAMTEHFAAQNEKITKQCDEIQALKHKLVQKK